MPAPAPAPAPDRERTAWAARETRDALTVAAGRLQLLARALDRSAAGPAEVRAALAAALAQIRRAADGLGVLERAAGAASASAAAADADPVDVLLRSAAAIADYRGARRRDA